MTVAQRGSAVLYTPELLALAVRLSEWPWEERHDLNGEARSRTCGSAVAVSLTLTLTDGQVGDVGLKVSACAVGQAAAAIFAGAATGRSKSDIRRARDELSAWLAGEGGIPDWSNVAALEPALPHQGRHGAILLPWEAALDALSKSASPA